MPFSTPAARKEREPPATTPEEGLPQPRTRIHRRTPRWESASGRIALMKVVVLFQDNRLVRPSSSCSSGRNCHARHGERQQHSFRRVPELPLCVTWCGARPRGQKPIQGSRWDRNKMTLHAEGGSWQGWHQAALREEQDRSVSSTVSREQRHRVSCEILQLDGELSRRASNHSQAGRRARDALSARRAYRLPLGGVASEGRADAVGEPAIDGVLTPSDSPETPARPGMGDGQCGPTGGCLSEKLRQGRESQREKRAGG